MEKSSNMLFTNGDRTLYGKRFGEAVMYSVTYEKGIHVVSFKKGMIMDTPTAKHQTKTKLVCECSNKLAKEFGKIILTLYGEKIEISKKETEAEIETRIRKAQKKLIQFVPKIGNDIKNQITEAVDWDQVDIY